MLRTKTGSPTDDGRPTCRAKLGHQRPTLLVLAVFLVLAGLLSSCGQEKDGVGAAPLSDRAENDVPLNPPTLRFHVASDGRADASPDLEAEAGEVVAIVLENESDSTYELRLLDPDGNDVFTVEASPRDRGDGRAMPRDVGSYLVEVYASEKPRQAAKFTVEVSEN